MKIILSIVIFSFSYSVFANKYLDSTETHPYFKIVSYPFLYPKESVIDGSFAIGPCTSVSGEHFEMQIGILYDVQQYKYTEHLSPGQVFVAGMTPRTIKYYNFYLPLIFNYYFTSKKIKPYVLLGGGAVIPNADDSKGWVFAGGGISYKVSNKIKLNLSIHERLATGGLSQGAFFEVAYRLN
jgi:hypothetical protein